MRLPKATKADRTKNKWQTYNGSWLEFCAEGLNKPGTIIHTTKRAYLIGDINTLGGVCDDCMDFDNWNNEQILEYLNLT